MFRGFLGGPRPNLCLVLGDGSAIWLKWSRGGSCQHKDEFFYFFTARVGITFIRTGLHEPAFFQHTYGGLIVLGDPSIERANHLLLQERLKSSGGNSQPPVLSPNPIADFGLAEPAVAYDVSSDGVSVENGSQGGRLISQDLLPMGIKS